MSSSDSKRSRKSKGSRKDESRSDQSSSPSASINEVGDSEKSKPKASLDALPRPKAATRNWDDLPGIRKKPSLAPPTPPPSQAPAPPTVHELFDISTDDAEYERDKARQRAVARESLRPHPPRPSHTPDPPRLPTPLSWTATTDPTTTSTDAADAVEEAAEDLLEPAPDSLPEIPTIVSAEPLASVIPTGSVLVTTGERKAERRFGTARIVAVAAVALVGIGALLLTGRAPDESSSNHAAFPLAPAADQTLAKPTLPPAPPKSIHDLDLGVPLTGPSASAALSSAPTAVDPASIPPVAPSGVLPTRPKEREATEVQPFNSDAATAALGQAASNALSCRKEGDPTGSATVIVRYAPSGRVTSATVEAGPFTGTPTGGCVAMTFRKAWIPPFTGDFVTVKKTVILK